MFTFTKQKYLNFWCRNLGTGIDVKATAPRRAKYLARLRPHCKATKTTLSKKTNCFFIPLERNEED